MVYVTTQAYLVGCAAIHVAHNAGHVTRRYRLGWLRSSFAYSSCNLDIWGRRCLCALLLQLLWLTANTTSLTAVACLRMSLQ